MLNNYDPNMTRNAVHTVRVTFMQWGYVGHVAYEIGGNCQGADLLNCNFLETDDADDIGRYPENDCNFAFHEDEEQLTATLTAPDGNTLDVEGDGEEFKNMVVAIEFSAVRPKEERSHADA
ncbi:DUF5406 family protein [uncultured Oscillibacter sp.]|uniref:DUF5406 family protein n=1 Tax=uncultured Oscillibacter sp. TaxID=876091 RepID=UPI0025F3CFC2|nr:DUF5406 family protein [uncultured Oscillibacter sp.]